MLVENTRMKTQRELVQWQAQSDWGEFTLRCSVEFCNSHVLGITNLYRIKT